MLYCNSLPTNSSFQCLLFTDASALSPAGAPLPPPAPARLCGAAPARFQAICGGPRRLPGSLQHAQGLHGLAEGRKRGGPASLLRGAGPPCTRYFTIPLCALNLLPVPPRLPAPPEPLEHAERTVRAIMTTTASLSAPAAAGEGLGQSCRGTGDSRSTVGGPQGPVRAALHLDALPAPARPPTPPSLRPCLPFAVLRTARRPARALSTRCTRGCRQTARNGSAPPLVPTPPPAPPPPSAGHRWALQRAWGRRGGAVVACQGLLAPRPSAITSPPPAAGALPLCLPPSLKCCPASSPL